MKGAELEAVVRVVLVGRTGLDGALRLDPGVELLRVRTALEAIGELSAPIDSDSPARSVVVLSAEVEAGLLEGPEGEARAAQFVEALRLVDPLVSVMGVGDSVGRDGRLCASRVDPSSPAGVVREAIRRGPARRAASAEAGPTGGDPARAAVEDVSTSRPGDGAIVEMLLRGRDVLEVALSVLRERVGDPGLEFVRGSSPGEESTGMAAVGGGSAVHGFLRSTRVREGVLEEHARWLAGWLRLRDQQRQLWQAAFTDPLTGAWNRRYFERYMGATLEEARANRWYVSVLVFDIDNFKRYNDDYGHEAGDEILIEVVRLLRSVTRPSDRICRIGGDEFAVIFYDPRGPRVADSKHPATVSQIAQRFQEQVRGHRFPKLSQCAPGTLTISGGLATFPWDGSTAGELLARADERAMTSKRQGKNVITLGPGDGLE